ncbi:purine permease 21-like isoform X2 [Cornus florida]|uniref:purine permease 21-like isoform X2 n=1 Tax=Cornus florida TaxID=4283 RepID=UPI002897AD6A|nr:purine permease 21-like isoform X2 [Cornus florida]
MGEAQELQLHIMVEEAKEANSTENANVSHQSTIPWLRKYKWWLQMAIYSFFVLSGQSAATLLGRLYYDKGGNSKWMATLVQTAGFPVLIPFLCIAPNENRNTRDNHPKPPSAKVLASLYTFLGIFLAAVCMLYSIGLMYLPVSTYSLICASQLGFNAAFSFFLNSQKLTPFIVNSLVLLTISSTLLVFQPDDSASSNIPKGKYAIGFICTVGASAGYALILSVTQLSYRRILKSGTFRVVLDLIIYQSLVATGVILVGLFASGEWKSLHREMEEFGLGKVSYVMNLVWTALSWQVFSIGATKLIFELSSLFCNVISTLGLPIVPVLAVFFFHDKMNGVKVVAMLLAIWGFVSYIYQHYLDDLKSKADSGNVNGVPKLPSPEEAEH